MSGRASHSLRRRLLWFVLAAILLAAVAQALTTYRGALRQADDMFDYHLQQMAYAMRGGVPLSPLSDPAAEDDDDFVIQIWGPDGAQLYRSAHSALPPRAVLGFSDLSVNGTRYRVYSLQSPLQTIQIAQDLSARQARASALALRAVLPIALLAPLLMLAVWWVISSSLAPIERTRKLVAARAADDLSALPEDGLPQEILPLVHELNQLFGRVQDAFRAQQHFVADAAHELRNPLAALKLQAQALRPSGHASSMDPASSELAVVRLNQGIDRAIRLVEQLLSLARQEAQDNRDIGAAQARQKVDLQALARQAVTDALPQARAKHIDLGLISTDEAWVHASPQAVLTLLGNLLDNAIKYTPQDGQIDVDWRMQDGVMRLAIDDSGPGIDVADRPRVFDRFYRAADPAVAGSGLGLAIVKAIADGQGASVRLASSTRLGGLRVEVDFAPAQTT